MPDFRLHFQRHGVVEPDALPIEFRDLHHAYLEVCRSIPDLAREELAAGQDPMDCGYVICDENGRELMEVDFAEILHPNALKRGLGSSP